MPVGVSLYADGRSYRLYWLSEIRYDGQPSDGDQFGLTIAGMHAVRHEKPAWGEIADHLSSYIGDLARRQRRLSPSPYAVASAVEPLQAFHSAPTVHGGPLEIILDAEKAAAVLRHESVMLNLSPESGIWRCTVSGRSLRPFLSVTCAADYLAVAWNEHTISTASTPVSALTLAQTIDYFGYVLEYNTDWPGELGHPVKLNSARTVGSISLSATTYEEFQDRISSLSTVIDQMALPEIPPAARKRYSNGAGSINRLAYLLRSRVSEEPYRSDVEDSLQMLRDLKYPRTQQQHDAASKRADAAEARSRFGLPPVTSSWESDWINVRGRVAEAFTKIIAAVQASVGS